MLNHVLLQPSTPNPIKWYEPTENARRVLDQFPDFTFSHLEYQAWAWPGGYEISYVTADQGVLCHQCANANLMRTLDPDDAQFYIEHEFINWEDCTLYCDHCGRQIEPAYGDSGESFTFGAAEVFGEAQDSTTYGD